MENRDNRRNYRRIQRRNHIRHKLNIIKNVYNQDPKYWCGSDPGRLDKAKVHCSYPWCSLKSKFFPKAADIRKKESMDAAMKEEEEEDEIEE